MSHWHQQMVDGAEFWISCKWLQALRKASQWQLIKCSAPSTICWRLCDIRIGRCKSCLRGSSRIYMMINRLAWQAFQYSGLVSYLMTISLPWAKLCGVVEWRECGGSKYGWWWWCSGWWPMWRPALWTPCPCWACKLVTEPVRLAMLELLLLEFGWDEPTSAWVVPSFCNLGFRGPRSCCTAKKRTKSIPF